MFFPDKSAGLRARMQMQARLTESVGHVLDRCRGVVAFNEAAAKELLAALTSSGKLKPTVYGRYFRAVRAILALGDAPDELALGAVADRLDQLLSSPFEAQQGIDIRPLSPARFTAVEEIEFREDFISESLDDAQILTVEATDAGSLALVARSALAMIAEHAPKTFSEFEQVIAEIVPAEGGESEQGLSFGGCSSLERWGSILINTSATSSVILLCEALIHEGAHNVLFGTSPVEFHTRNAPDELYKSPLRLDPRPIDGIYHATFVLARMCYGMREFATSPTLDPALRAEAQMQADEALCSFWDGYAVLEEHADYTDDGRAIMAAAHDYMAGLRASVPA